MSKNATVSNAIQAARARLPIIVKVFGNSMVALIVLFSFAAIVCGGIEVSSLITFRALRFPRKLNTVISLTFRRRNNKVEFLETDSRQVTNLLKF